jgi:hypothetical protein
MRYSYTSGYEDYKKALRTVIRSSRRQRIFFALKMWGFTTVGIVLLAIFAPTVYSPVNSSLAFIGYIAGCAMLGGGVVGSAIWPWQRRRAYRVWNGDDDVLSLYLEVDGPILITGRPGRAESRFERAAVCKTLEDVELLLLFLSKKKFVYIPKSIGEPALADIRGWLNLPGAPELC